MTRLVDKRLRRNATLRVALLILLAVFILHPSVFILRAELRPNFILLFVDDMGWTDPACFGSDLHEMLHIDRLAAEGTKFAMAYSSCTVCSPSRAAILTGKYPARLRVTDFIPGHGIRNTPLRMPDWTQRLEHGHVTIAEALKPAGYRTAHLGKWHLTPRDRDDANKTWPEYQPEKHGFDVNIGGYSAGAPQSYFWPYGRGPKAKENSLFVNLPKPETGKEGEYLTDRLTDEALKLIDGWKDEPFFFYFAYYNVHTPLQGKPELVEYYKKKIAGAGPVLRHTNPVYAAMVHSVDESVGRLRAKLEEHGIDGRTVIVFTSDNGGLRNNPGNPERVTHNGAIRNGKGSVYEGGVRVPGIVLWPGVTKPGSVSDEPVMGIDFFPTIMEIAQRDAGPNGRSAAGKKAVSTYDSEIDGVSLVPILRDAGAGLGRDALYWHYPHYHMGGGVPYSAVRSGDRRLLQFHRGDRLELYNLAEDIHEDTNLAESNPEKAEELRRKLDAWRAAVGAQMPVPNPDYDPNQPTGWKRGDKVRLPEKARRF